MVGNGATNWSYDVWPSFPQTLANFQIIEQSLLEDWEKQGCAAFFHNVRPATKTDECEAMAKRMGELSGQLNWYDLYRKNYDLPAVDRRGETVIDGKVRTYKRGMTMAEYTPFATHILDTPAAQAVNGDFLTDYMNREDVRKAFNIPSDVQTWEQCSETLRYNVQDEASMWIYQVLRNKTGLMFYSGDTDGAITTYGTKQWIKELSWPITESWRPWLTDGQVSGYTQMYDGLRFTTIKGVGHMAPQWARKATTNMIMAHVHHEDF
jgi:carboxypeptidase C (cathepsin A)|mmetsp:Transcript_20013/g.27027  ORF Transcript_20013/g.27027 Transcript_20013/m.27027 type:complete len:265 (-) Transcript_20013:111-905(-)|eukprot:Macronucleus_1821.p1 GENE.Macronucleus_1821~~Macronucleus_1821.p1  ORF type:complete len:265 (+),score=114.95 Macronucleus_1821:1-795(+)